ncbi:Glutamine transport ATP-binding protein GlnQ [Weissella viridescens]|uniref:Glutamine transport ATP-binding protein GlnQ n=1 Tax=Weissella viridescens TaxID=1629 RepID=A0A380P6Y4_WEIVI|nr:Glutamine transport ATP-binding protein GlnQ [Weissella viridescens]
MSMIEFKDVEKYYGDFHALHDINLEVEAGETVVLLGPSGSGKSTLIRTVNGLESIEGGQLIVNNQDLADPKTDLNRLRKDVGMVFQHFNLYENKTILENIMLAPRLVLHRDEDENKKLPWACWIAWALLIKLINTQRNCQVDNNNELRLHVHLP